MKSLPKPSKKTSQNNIKKLGSLTDERLSGYAIWDDNKFLVSNKHMFAFVNEVPEELIENENHVSYSPKTIYLNYMKPAEKFHVEKYQIEEAILNKTNFFPIYSEISFEFDVKYILQAYRILMNIENVKIYQNENKIASLFLENDIGEQVFILGMRKR